jgi:hypothetical protein|tara:strand:+ start:154 stop:537 length:384 start_codon:yes stop_codon:yes gene_type:complete
MNKKNLIKDSDDIFFELMGSEQKKGDFQKMMETMQKKYSMSHSFFSNLLSFLYKETKKHLNEKERNNLKEVFGMEISDQIMSEALLGKLKYDPIKKQFYESNKRVRIHLTEEGKIGKAYEISDQREH